jgi:hypothetical protein
MNKKIISKWVNLLLNIFAILLIISGLGITEYNIVEGLTFGLLNKAISFKLHTLLWIPFALLLIVRLYLNTVKWK